MSSFLSLGASVRSAVETVAGAAWAALLWVAPAAAVVGDNSHFTYHYNEFGVFHSEFIGIFAS